MTFDERLAAVAAQVERRLADFLSGVRGPVAPPDRLAAAMRYAALGGGKRLRPFLLIESAALFGVKLENALDAATALECIHAYSLVHDDLPGMDDDAMRRGRETVHIAYDEGTAILVGDGLLTLAFEILATPETHSDPAVRGELTLGLARAAGWAGMAGGQSLDLEAEGKRLRADEVRHLQALKTGVLIQYACIAGSILGQAPVRERSALEAYGRLLGQAFQLADDLLDVTGDEAKLGKRTGKDGDAGKATLVSLLGLEHAKTELLRLEAETIDALEVFGDRANILRETARFVSRREH
ncbi:MAG: polyprenyl synthetase family protein [Hyphomicrobiaceae bacterium]|nr:polyprenyl synthetase family protein [Hyphomicrobiaceae bacterium]